MMRFLICLSMVFVGAISVLAQGFDWAPSPRAPYTVPKQYIGIEVGSGYVLHGGSLNYVQQDLGITCCQHSSGTGIPFRIAVIMEQWLSAEVSASASVGISSFGVDYTTPARAIPLSDGVVLQTEYLLSGSLQYVTLMGGVSMRLFASSITVGGGFRAHLYAGGSLTNSERVVSPDSYFFTTNPRSKEVELESVFLEDARAVLFEPYLSVGYNIPIARGTYLTPSISAGVMLQPVTQRDSWRMFDMGLHIRLVKSL